MNQPGADVNRRLPNFLLVGAAKSATSSLHYYLDQHPQIKMASQKESWFFSFYGNPPRYDSPGVLSDVISELDEYLTLYDGAGSGQLLGDACPSYLYTYEDTIRNIQQLYSGPALDELRIIISLREPVSRAYSQYYTFKRKVQEPLPFAQAVAADTIERRLRDNWNIFYDYLGFGMYARQVEAFQQAFGKARVHVVLFDDINADMQQTCRGIFEFLGIDPEFSVDDRYRINEIAGEPRVKWFVAGVFSQNRLKRLVSALLPQKFRALVILFVLKRLLRRETMDADTRQQIAQRFDADIRRLETLIGRDLSHWRCPR